MTGDRLKNLALDVLAGKSRSYVTDARTFAEAIIDMMRKLEDYDQMLANLTATQGRCTELLEEARELKRQLEGRCVLHCIRT